MWKFENFPVAQILREIKVGKSRVSKCAILTHLEALNFDFYEFLHILKAEIDQKVKIQSLQNCKKKQFRSTHRLISRKI